jgi:hypothetical protein
MAVPLINGEAYNWGQILLTVLGQPITGVTAITFTSKQDKVNNYGAGYEPVSRGRGKKEYEGSITFLMEEFKNIISAAPNQDVLDIPAFDISVKWLDPASGLLMSVTLKASEFMENGIDSKSGDTMVEVKVPLIIGKIQYSDIV